MLAGCGPNRKAVLAYSEAVAAATKKLEAPRHQFSDKFGAALNGGPAEKQRLRQALDEWKTAVAEVRKEIDGLKDRRERTAGPGGRADAVR